MVMKLSFFVFCAFSLVFGFFKLNLVLNVLLYKKCNLPSFYLINFFFVDICHYQSFQRPSFGLM